MKYGTNSTIFSLPSSEAVKGRTTGKRGKERMEKEERERKEELKREQETQKKIERLTNRATQEYLRYRELDIALVEKITRLEKARIVEYDTSIKFKLEKQIEEAQEERKKIQKMMRGIASSYDVSV